MYSKRTNRNCIGLIFFVLFGLFSPTQADTIYSLGLASSKVRAVTYSGPGQIDNGIDTYKEYLLIRSDSTWKLAGFYSTLGGGLGGLAQADSGKYQIKHDSIVLQSDVCKKNRGECVYQTSAYALQNGIITEFKDSIVDPSKNQELYQIINKRTSKTEGEITIFHIFGGVLLFMIVISVVAGAK